MSAFEISKQPFLRDLQVLQLAIEVIDDASEKRKIAELGLSQIGPEGIVGRFLTVDSRIAIGLERSRSKIEVYDSGVLFNGRVEQRDFYADYDVPIESVVLDFRSPKVLVPENEVYAEPELLEQLCSGDTEPIDLIRTPILAIRACAVEMPKVA